MQSARSAIQTTSPQVTWPTDKNQITQAKAFFRQPPFVPIYKPRSISEVTILANGSPMRPPRAGEFVLQQAPSTNDATSREMTGSIANNSTPASPPRSKIRTVPKNVQQMLEKAPESQDGSRKFFPSEQDANSLLSVFDFHSTNETHTGSYLKIDKVIYFIGKELGDGASAKVYLACDKYNTLYAIKFFKIISAEDDHTLAEKITARANNEISFLCELNRLANLQTIRYTDTLEQTYVIVPMLYIANTITLTKYLTENNETLVLENRYNLAIKLCMLVEELHQKDIAHGDIKPENILINPTTKELFLVDYECAAHDIDTPQPSYGTEMYRVPNRIETTPRQADIIALMRCLLLNSSFITARDAENGKDYVQSVNSNLAIFITSSDNQNLIDLLSTTNESCIATLPRSVQELMQKLITSAPNPRRAMIRAGLEWEKYHRIRDKDSYEFYYIIMHYDAYFNDSSESHIILLQTLRVMSHQYKLTKIQKMQENPFFNQAIAEEELDSSTLKSYLYSKKPNLIITHSSMYKASPKYKQDSADFEARLNEIGIL